MKVRVKNAGFSLSLYRSPTSLLSANLGKESGEEQCPYKTDRSFVTACRSRQRDEIGRSESVWLEISAVVSKPHKVLISARISHESRSTVLYT